jgi:hypothetical protein
MSGDPAGVRTALGALEKTLIVCLPALVIVGGADRPEPRQYSGIADYDARFLKGMLNHPMIGAW